MFDLAVCLISFSRIECRQDGACLGSAEPPIMTFQYVVNTCACAGATQHSLLDAPSMSHQPPLLCKSRKLKSIMICSLVSSLFFHPPSFVVAISSTTTQLGINPEPEI